ARNRAAPGPTARSGSRYCRPPTHSRCTALSGFRVINRAVTKYLRAHAEPECAALEEFPLISPQHVLVLPAFRETPDFAERITAKSTSGVLVIVVINQPEGQEEPLNRELMNFFQRYPSIWQNGNLSLFSANNGDLHWLVVDRFSSGRTIAAKQGVGLARKLG